MFMNALEDNLNHTGRTDNGAVTLNTSKSAVLDFFSRAGAMRESDDKYVFDLFRKAYAEDPILAMKVLFYIRDIRGGQGERKVFRTILTYLFAYDRSILEKVVPLVPEYGRWDDLFANGNLFEASLPYLKTIFAKKGNYTFQELGLFKWMPSINTSSKQTVAMAKKFVKALNTTPRIYRKQLALRRSELALVETAMSQNAWDVIDYEKVPSNASMKYRKAFKKHDEERYSNYLSSVEKGKKKINANVLYPYELVRTVFEGNADSTIDALWNALPSYVPEGTESLVVADVSGSMAGLPLYVSISLAMYLAERNQHPAFKNKFLTFSEHPSLQTVRGRNLQEKVMNLNSADWDMNTNVNAVFKLLLDTAVNYNVPKEQMVKLLIICSDMEFDFCGGKRTNFESAKKMFNDAGYDLPEIVFWNVAGSSGQHSPVTKDERGVMLVSGCSPSIFKNALVGKITTPYEMMLDVLNSDRYKAIEEVLN